MSKFFKGFASVYVENGFHKVVLPNGTKIPHLVKTVTECDVDRAEVTFTVLCNNVSSFEEAIRGYNKDIENTSPERFLKSKGMLKPDFKRFSFSGQFGVDEKIVNYSLNDLLEEYANLIQPKFAYFPVAECKYEGILNDDFEIFLSMESAEIELERLKKEFSGNDITFNILIKSINK